MRLRASTWGAILSILISVGGQRLAAQQRGSAPQSAPGALECLALTLYWEAGNERRTGMVGVGWVVLNRRAHPDFPSTVCEVVRQGGEMPGCQFTYWCDGKGDTPRARDVWTRARAVADDMLANRTADPTGGALFFHAVSLGDAPWKVPRTRTTQIGKHLYYR